ncbi:hypothetical protein AN4587.2 [Aspergillus nidulans FGSC A4]|uniref:Methylated-DNA--protein-cysteine methyltransferase n=1 Tax=Emericella nidulans (strain FGSC A4 / ATCC 38163 / CBS 112.46 / NRRL 194 / M139) TaxID=227321 RepID=Q5B4E3_EMENI|nr:hypothetical protein [Aspergillus nidulans FGSC A4]EAA60930.1 hypothetical protein AN4587.2 [Aspergillus nidulans FGSC A4]CBF77199.1 TPA: methylated-DNA-protein-cysteine methyltransferase (AFU_orthologue; AFUA_2G02090) [Aspergillus nidulans FGSC A4]|eukprot:XP_662191.1 hypothetical protein AN4587.2 [Aspergillus nidulans FGSC A4]
MTLLCSRMGNGLAEADTYKKIDKRQEYEAVPVDQTQILAKKVIQHPALTPFRKSLYLALLQIPPGQWTTYAALAKHTNSSARAVGTAMRLNPFAPGVPCHRVLASDGTLGGYMGTPSASVSARSKGSGKGIEKGGNLERKRRMLEEEGVKFDLKGRVIGTAFVAFRS